MTDGILIQEMLSDPLLSDYSVIIIDDCHDRSTNTDILLSLVKKVQQHRKDLKLVVSSASIDPRTYFNYFNQPDMGLKAQVV